VNFDLISLVVEIAKFAIYLLQLANNPHTSKFPQLISTVNLFCMIFLVFDSCLISVTGSLLQD